MVADHLKIPSVVIPDIIFFIFVQILLPVIFTTIIWVITRLIGVALTLNPVGWIRPPRAVIHQSKNRSMVKTIMVDYGPGGPNPPYEKSIRQVKLETIGFSLWGVGVGAVLLANQIYFPNSKFSDLTSSFLNDTFALILLIIFSGILLIAIIFALVGLDITLQKKTRSTRFLALIFLVASVLFICFSKMTDTTITSDASTASKPNIIIIGMDAIRPDFIGFFGGENQTHFIDQFLNQSIVFADALTPLARTFPSWISLLTGLYPKHSGARFDLAEQSQLDWSASLPKILQKQGYETLYAMDETRFSNIEKQAGFDHIITPPTGFNDFLLGTFNDFPFSNLIVNTTLGKWLFPYSYGNRPAFVTYDPDSFLALLKPALQKNRKKPLFLAVHFCLPHAPYLWDRSHAHEKVITQYQAAIQRTDKQVADFFEMLSHSGLLQHSIVVLLSDHGEALELHGDRITDPELFIAGLSNPKKIIPHFYPPSFESEKVDESAGHGTDVLGLTQYHSLLAFRFYGMDVKPKMISNLVSLLDVKPTLLNFLGLKDFSVDGNSLMKMIRGEKIALSASRHLFLESDFSPQSVRTVHPEMRNVLFEGIDYYQIDPLTAHLTVKNSMSNVIISSKQYADVYQDWMLALYPQSDGLMLPILVNLRDGRWTNDLTTEFALKSPAREMQVALKNFYN
ncbi:MAG: sulfatase-like hydrolase/transferase [Gammaproteobacteria bacterium]|nr:sulfatase-like hydrolase/transferase [Gammaproteobacteria bacterium]